MQMPTTPNWMTSAFDHWLAMSPVRVNDPGSKLEFVVKRIPRQEVTAELITRWRDLESRSCHVNAFLSPDFLLPAWKWMEPAGGSFLLTVEEVPSGRLRALGCFEDAQADTSLPLPHLVAAKTIHSFRTGLLLDEETVNQTLGVWLKFLQTQRQWGGVVFPSLRQDSRLAQYLQSAIRAGNLSWHTVNPVPSAAVFTPVLTDERLHAHQSSHRQKSLRHKLRQLESLGPVRLRWIDEPAEIAEAIEQFLILEHAGWKGAEGTSLMSDPAGAEFLRSMATGFFERGRLVLTQLLAGDQVVATSTNLRGGSTLYAFKIGWDPRFAKASPGMLHQNLLQTFVCQNFPEVTCIDSCARAGSFLEDIWPDRISVADAVIPTSRLALSAVAALNSVRYVKNLLHNIGK